MAKSKIQTVEEKLRALYTLQLIDSNIDRIKTIRGELPLEVQDLEDEIAGLNTRLEKVQNEISDLENAIAEKKNGIKDSKALIKKYEEQQNNVRNNREFDSLNKEMEYQTLEIKVFEKRIKEHSFQIESKKELIENTKNSLSEREADLNVKKKELEEIVGETQKEEEILLKKSEEASTLIEERLLNAYRRIRSGAKNGLAVVAVERGSSGGSFIQIPPQRQLDIAARKKVIVDEHSGRILVDKDLADEETEKVEKLLQKALK